MSGTRWDGVTVEVGAAAELGFLIFFRYYDERGSWLRSGVVTEVDAAGVAWRWREFGGEDGHSRVGLSECRVLGPDGASGRFDIERAIVTLEKRGMKRFRDIDSARKFMLRFLK